MTFRIDIQALAPAGPVMPLQPVPGNSAPRAPGQATSEQSVADAIGSALTADHDGITAFYDPGTRKVILTNTDKGSVAVAKVLRDFRFDFGDAYPRSVGTVLAGKVIKGVTVTILVPFDDPAATLSLSGLVAPEDVDLTAVGTFLLTPGVDFPSNTLIELTIDPAGSTAGTGLLSFSLEG